MIGNIKFRKVKCWFQNKLLSDIRTNTKKSEQLLVPLTKLPVSTGWMHPHTMISCRRILPSPTKSGPKHHKSNNIDLEAKCLAKKPQLDDCINATAKCEAFYTLKDHKPNFANNPTCRLINPAKSDINKVSKQILDRINTTRVSKLGLNQ